MGETKKFAKARDFTPICNKFFFSRRTLSFLIRNIQFLWSLAWYVFIGFFSVELGKINKFLSIDKCKVASWPLMYNFLFSRMFENQLYWYKKRIKKMRKYLSDLTGNGELRVSLRSLAGPVPCIVIKYVLKCKLFKINNIMNNN